ncbi:MAG: MFS transporter [Actinobacteria bacterium]|nr:MFS transporter [Actinomycetota bacterium]
MTDYPVRRNALLLAGGLVCLSGMFQLSVALATITLVAVTGIEGILGLGPAIFLCAGALAALPAGRAMDRYGRMPVIRAAFATGMAGSMVTALGCRIGSAALVILGFACAGASAAVVLLSRAAAAEMFPPERRARGMSLVLFGAVAGAVFGPLVFGPLFSGRELTADELALPWLSGSLFMLGGLILSFGVRPDPKVIGSSHPGEPIDDSPAAPLRELVRRPGVGTALVAAVASFAVMVGVMNLTGYVAVGHGHHQSDVFTIISAHIVGMYGLVLVTGDLIDRMGRRVALALGLAVMALSTLSLVWLDGLTGMSLSLVGLGLGWNVSFVAATTQLVSLARPSERGRLVGLSDQLSSFVGAGLALFGGLAYSSFGVVTLALSATVLVVLPALWIVGRPGKGLAASPGPA